jgi:hypothetical protein
LHKLGILIKQIFVKITNKDKINRFKVWDYSGNGNHGFLYQDYNVNDIQNRILDKIKGE